MDASGRRMTITFRSLTPQLMDELGAVLRGNSGASCWCIYPRLTDRQMRELPGSGSLNQRRREVITGLTRRSGVPRHLAFEDGEPVGWIALAPRGEFTRVNASRARLPWRPTLELAPSGLAMTTLTSEQRPYSGVRDSRWCENRSMADHAIGFPDRPCASMRRADRRRQLA